MNADTSQLTEDSDLTAGEGTDRANVDTVRHLLVLAAAVLVWLWSVNRVNEADMGEFGLITILPISTFVALAMAVIGFTVATRLAKPDILLPAYVMTIAVMLHGIPTFAYTHLRFGWAWKHVGMVDYIQRYGDVAPGEGDLSVYHSWPGFFGVNAWITDSSGLDSALSYAAWAPILFNLLFVGALYMLFRAFTDDRRLIWTAILIFVLGSWVGQDYFAPQAIAFFMYLLLLGMLLRWYSKPLDADGGLEREAIEPGTMAAFAIPAVMVLAMAMIASSHQLTPVITVAAISALVVFRQLRVRWPLYVMVGVTLVWFLGPARDFVFDNAAKVIRELGGVQTNLDSTVVDLGIVRSSQRTISLVSRLLSASIFGLAGLGWLRRRSRGERSNWLILLAVVPVAMVFASSYGGEIILRSYLFALPFAAFLAASLWFPSSRSEGGLRSPIVLGSVLSVLLVGLLIANFGADQRQVFNDGEVAAANYVVTTAGPGSLIIEGTRDYPRLHQNNEIHTYLTVDRLPEPALDRLLADPDDVLSEWLTEDERYTGGYIILTGSQRASVSTLGSTLVPTLSSIEHSLRSSPLFEIGFEAQGAVVFQPVGKS